MSGDQLRAARERLGMTQQQAARRWRLSQAYVSLVENNKRRVPERLGRLLAPDEPSAATALPLDVSMNADLPPFLGSLGYPGFAYLGNPRDVMNPASLLLAALRHSNLPARVTEALPWLLTRFVDLDWNWLVNESKRWNVQNRLGYLISLALDVARQRDNPAAVSQLESVLQQLEDARLVKEDSLGRTLTESERRYLREHRPPAAAHWNLLTNLRADDLRYAL